MRGARELDLPAGELVPRPAEQLGGPAGPRPGLPEGMVVEHVGRPGRQGGVVRWPVGLGEVGDHPTERPVGLRPEEPQHRDVHAVPRPGGSDDVVRLRPPRQLELERWEGAEHLSVADEDETRVKALMVDLARQLSASVSDVEGLISWQQVFSEVRFEDDLAAYHALLRYRGCVRHE